MKGEERKKENEEGKREREGEKESRKSREEERERRKKMWCPVKQLVSNKDICGAAQSGGPGKAGTAARSLVFLV